MYTASAARHVCCRHVLPPIVQAGRSCIHALRLLQKGLGPQCITGISRLQGRHYKPYRLGLNCPSFYSTITAAAVNNEGDTSGESPGQLPPLPQAQWNLLAAAAAAGDGAPLTRETLVQYLKAARLREKQRSEGPEATTSAAEEKEISQSMMALDDDQWRAVTSLAQYVQVIAGPGAGKTLTLLTRVWALLAAGAKPEEIVVVAFTNNAATELYERCCRLVGQTVADALQPCTIHALCRQVLRDYGGLLNLPYEFNGNPTADKITRRQIVMDIMVENDLLKRPKTRSHRYENKKKSKVFFDLISLLKNFEEHIDGPTDNGDYLVSQHYERGRSRTKPLEEDLVLMYDAYQAVMREKCVIDHDDELHLTLTLIRRYPEVLVELHRRWKHILIDETQDLNKCQHALFRAFTGPQTTLFEIGDPKQSMYGFRGASAEKWQENFKLYGDKGETVLLNNNYRSRKAIVVAGNILREISYAVCSDPLPPEEQIDKRQESVIRDPAVPVVEMRNCTTANGEIDAIIKKIEYWHSLGYEWREMAVLAQSVKPQMFKDLQSMLKAKNIPMQLVMSDDDKNEQQWLQEDKWQPPNEQAVVLDPQVRLAQQEAELTAAEDEHRDAVQLMTIHNSKGKEFPCVVIAAADELFYFASYLRKGEKWNEIRQKYNQAYVGVCRAQDHLLVTWSVQEQNRYKRTSTADCRQPLRELARDLLLLLKPDECRLLGIVVVLQANPDSEVLPQ